MAGTGKSRTSPARIAVNEKQARALELRKAGVGYQEIADELGYASASGAFEAVKSALDRMLREPADALREIELDRLDTMWSSVWENVLAGDLDSIGTALRITERRARLLGLDVKESALKLKMDADTAKSLRDLVSVKDRDKKYDG